MALAAAIGTQVMFMHNFDTGEMQPIEDVAALDDSIVLQFIPKFPAREGGAARGLYRVLRLQGRDKHEALIEVLRLATGDKK